MASHYYSKSYGLWLDLILYKDGVKSGFAKMTHSLYGSDSFKQQAKQKSGLSHMLRCASHTHTHTYSLSLTPYTSCTSHTPLRSTPILFLDFHNLLYILLNENAIQASAIHSYTNTNML
jgi:hypothetical protein